MSYNSMYGFIPGYDALARLSSSWERQRHWEKNVGSKGRKIAYYDRRPDFGSLRQAYREISNDVSFGMSDLMNPF